MKQKGVMKLGNSVKKQVFKNILKFANFIKPSQYWPWKKNHNTPISINKGNIDTDSKAIKTV